MKKNIFIGVNDDNRGGVLTAAFSFDTLLHTNYIEASDFTRYESTNWGGADDLDRICNMKGIKLTGRSVDLATPIKFRGDDYDCGMRYPWSVAINRILEVKINDKPEEFDDNINNDDTTTDDMLSKMSEYMILNNEILTDVYPDAIRLLNNLYGEAHSKGYRKGRKEGLMEGDEIVKELLKFYLTSKTDDIYDLFNDLKMENIIQTYTLEDIKNKLHDFEIKKLEAGKNESENTDISKVKPGCKIIDLHRNTIYTVSEVTFNTIDSIRSIAVYNPNIDDDCTILSVDPYSIKMIDNDSFFGKIKD